MKQKYCVYRFLDKFKNILYIGKTKNIRARISQHFSSQGHLPKKCYENVCYIEYAELVSHNAMDIYEMYLIDTYRPKYNTEYVFEGERLDMELPKLEWKFYLFGNDMLINKDNFELSKTLHDEEIEKIENLKLLQSSFINLDRDVTLAYWKIDYLLESIFNVTNDEKIIKKIEIARHELECLLNRKESSIGLIKAIECI